MLWWRHRRSQLLLPGSIDRHSHRSVWYLKYLYICSNLYKQVGVGIVVTSRNPHGVMVSPLAWNARDVGSIPVVGTIFPIFLLDELSLWELEELRHLPHLPEEWWDGRWRDLPYSECAAWSLFNSEPPIRPAASSVCWPRLPSRDLCGFSSLSLAFDNVNFSSLYSKTDIRCSNSLLSIPLFE